MSNERSRFDVMIEDSCFAMPGVINIPVCMQLVYVVECAAAVQLSFDSRDRPTRILLSSQIFEILQLQSATQRSSARRGAGLRGRRLRSSTDRPTDRPTADRRPTDPRPIGAHPTEICLICQTSIRQAGPD